MPIARMLQHVYTARNARHDPGSAGCRASRVCQECTGIRYEFGDRQPVEQRDPERGRAIHQHVDRSASKSDPSASCKEKIGAMHDTNSKSVICVIRSCILMSCRLDGNTIESVNTRRLRSRHRRTMASSAEKTAVSPLS